MNTNMNINQLDDNGLRHGTWEFYDAHGHLYCRSRYNHGKTFGPVETYNSFSGKLFHKGAYKKGSRCGLWEDYSTDGNLIRKGEWKPGSRPGFDKKQGLFFEDNSI